MKKCHKCRNIARGCPPTPTSTQRLWIVVLILEFYQSWKPMHAYLWLYFQRIDWKQYDIRQSGIVGDIRYLFDFTSTHAILSPVKSYFWPVFRVPGYFRFKPWEFHGYQKMWNFLAHLLIYLKHFWSSTIWTIQIQVSRIEFKNPKNPGIQPSDAIFEKLVSRPKIITRNFGGEHPICKILRSIPQCSVIPI